MNDGRNNSQDNYDDNDFGAYDEFEEKHGRGGFEKSNKNDNTGKFSGKKKIKPRQLVDVDIY